MMTGYIMRGRWFANLLWILVLFTGVSQANGGWVIERDEKSKSPLFKNSKSIANQLTPEQKEQQAIARTYIKALDEYRDKIRGHWPSGEVSSQTRWVSYSGNWDAKRVVDFENNRVEISVENKTKGSRIDFASLSVSVRQHVEEVIGARVNDAVNQDPVNQAVIQKLAELGAEKPEPSGELVMPELFNKANPSQREVKARAMQLMKGASIRYQALSASLAAMPVKTNNKITYVIPLPDNRIRQKVKEYLPLVRKHADRFSLADDIVMSIIHTESHFNPLARSHVPAFGLMQIVPSTAGRDASRKLFKRSKLLSARYLYNPKKNIEVGTAYLNVLYYDYLKGIENPESRLYYSIAAYNAGASAVAKAFIDKASFKDALPVINKMKPEEVLDRILTRLPRKETRQYVEKVLKRRGFYRRV
ncbi:MAG: transglycosylase SLT domain-containing protein [Pseudomonadales bacterium]|nr:transglycosylase SLT domain-containing protein [Pseudomonadales bacterium]